MYNQNRVLRKEKIMQEMQEQEICGVSFVLPCSTREIHLQEAHNLRMDPFDLPYCRTPVFVILQNGISGIMERTGFRWYFSSNPNGVSYPLKDAVEWREFMLI